MGKFLVLSALVLALTTGNRAYPSKIQTNGTERDTFSTLGASNTIENIRPNDQIKYTKDVNDSVNEYQTSSHVAEETGKGKNTKNQGPPKPKNQRPLNNLRNIYPKKPFPSQTNPEDKEIPILTETSKPPVILSDLLNNIGLKHPKAVNSFSYSQNESTRICWYERVFAQFDSNDELNHTWVEYEVVFETPSNDIVENRVDLVQDQEFAYINILDPYSNITQERPFKQYWNNENTSIWVNETRRCGKANHLDKTYKEELDGSSKYLSIRLTNMVREDLVSKGILENKKSVSAKDDDAVKNKAWIGIPNHILGKVTSVSPIKSFQMTEETPNKAQSPYKLDNNKHSLTESDYYVPKETTTEITPKRSLRSRKNKIKNYVENDNNTVGISHGLVNSNNNNEHKNIDFNTNIQPLNSNIHNVRQNDKKESKNLNRQAAKSQAKSNYFSEDQESQEIEPSLNKLANTNEHDDEDINQIKDDNNRSKENQLNNEYDSSTDDYENYDNNDQQPMDDESPFFNSLVSMPNKVKTVNEKVECPPTLTNIFINSKFLPHLCSIQVNDKDKIEVKGTYLATKKVIEKVNGREVEVEKPLFELMENTKIQVF